MKRALAFFLLAMSLHAQQPTVVQGYNQFGFKLLGQLVRENPGKNIFISPASIAFALSMAADGAHGETLEQMRQVLGVSGTNWDLENNQLLTSLSNSASGITLDIANSLWIDKFATVKPAYLKQVADVFQAKASNCNFQDPATIDAINHWVSEKTRSKIPTIVEPPLPRDLRLLLIDAVYFKGEWTSKFDPKLTQPKPFTNAAAQTVTCPLMSKTGKFQYAEDDDFQAVTLPYGDQSIVMCVLLPKKVLSGAESFHGRFSERPGTLELPRFKVENDRELKPDLQKLGMTNAFDPDADFSGMSEEPLLIGAVKHKTYVEVNEEGTEAAAVTSVQMRAMAVMRPPPPFQMIVNHPFFVEIDDDRTGLILFLGAIQDPR